MIKSRTIIGPLACLRTILTGSVLLLASCSSQSNLTTRPIKWTDPDNRTISEPLEVRENQIWDIVDHTFFYQVRKVLDLGWSARRIGNLLSIADERQADNVNALDEVPNSSWFTNRHFLKKMSLAQLKQGPGEAVPDTNGT